MDSTKRKLSTSFITNVVSSMGQDMNNFVLVKHYGKFSIDMEDARNAMMLYDNVDVYYSHFSNNEMVASFEPFLTIIKNCYIKYYSDKSIDEYLSLFDVYSLHRSFFKSYIESGSCERYEPYVLDDIGYEKKKMFESMTHIIIELSKQYPMLIIIDNIHMVTQSTITFLNQLTDNPDNKNIGIFAAYNDLKHIPSVTSDTWEQYIKIATTKHFVYEGGFYESKEDTEELSKFVFNGKRAYEYLLKLRLMYCAVDLEQADFYLQKIHEKLSNEKMNIDFACKYELFKLYTQVSIYLQDFSTALLICDNLKEMCEINPLPEFEYEYHYLYAFTQVYNGKPEYAKNSVERCKEIAIELNDEEYIFRSEILICMSKMLGWHNIFFLSTNIEISDSFLKKLEEKKYYNHLAYTYIYAYDNDLEVFRNTKTTDEYAKKQIKHQSGISLAEQIGNYCLVQKAYRKVIMMSSAIGLFNTTQYYYNELIELIKDDNEIELANIKNGQGYGYCTCREFEKANESYNTAFSIFMKYGDINSAGESLYNMALNCILAGAYHNAYDYLKICISIVEKMRLNDLRVCNLAKLNGLLALCSFRLSYEYDSIFYLNTNKKFLAHIINNRQYRDADKPLKIFVGNDDELYLHYLVKGLIDYKNEEYENSLNNYIMAEKHCLKSDANLFFSFVQLKVAMADTYNKLNRKEEALAVIDEAYQFAQERGFEDQLIPLRNMKETGEYVLEAKEMPLKNYTLDDINALLDKSSVITQYQDTQNHLEFVSIWQNILEINEKTKADLINTAANSFMLNFSLDSFMFIKFYEDSAEIMFNEGYIELTNKDIEMLRDYFEKAKTGFATAKSDKNYDDYQKVLDMFGTDILCSIICNPFFENEKLDSLFVSCIYMKTNWSFENYRNTLNESEASIFNLLLKQLLLAIDKIEYLNKIKQINTALKESSFTDYLTGLKNRNGFYEKIHRVIEKPKEEPLNLAVLYIDLDNFKYYNDTFGHDVGDLVLKEIAEILNISAGENGFAVRYGGDEFLIVLTDTNKEEAIATAKMTLDTILMRNGFTNEISILLGKPIVINREKRVSCSIGVSFSPDVRSNHELSRLIKNADASLYSVKHTTKNAVKFFEG